MALKSIRGGFELPPEDDELCRRQKVLTMAINDKFIQVGTSWLKPGGKDPIDPDWSKGAYRDVKLEGWIDDEEHQRCNLGFNLYSGWMDVDIDASDPEYNHFINAALLFTGVDTRFSFGRQSFGCPTHVLVQLVEDDAANYEYLRRFEPKPFRLGQQRFHVQMRSIPTVSLKKNAAVAAQQTVVPGSVYAAKVPGKDYDVSVWYTPEGQVAENVSSIAVTTPRPTEFRDVIRAIAFGTIAYTLRKAWVEGSRQVTATKVTGWLARLVTESEALATNEVLGESVYCSIADDLTAENFVQYLCHVFGDDEPHMRLRTYRDARGKLERNPDARVPGWQSLKEIVGQDGLDAIKAVTKPGSDTSVLSQYAEQYLYCDTLDRYIDRKALMSGAPYEYESVSLMRRHASDHVMINGKPRPAFQLFESSKIRNRVVRTDTFPDLEPGNVYRLDHTNRVLADDDPSELAHTVINTWKGWPVTPIETIVPEVMTRAVKQLNELLCFLTCDEPLQVDWIKKWIAWTFQFPGKKQQVAWVCVGGQGIGKSFFGSVLMPALMGRLAGTAAAKTLTTDFIISPFKDKMFVFMDEADFTRNPAAADEIKKLVRSVVVNGAEKNINARDYNIYARMMFASNKNNTGVSERDVSDRALFYTRAYDEHYKCMTQPQFRAWAATLKPFFDTFSDELGDYDFCRHLVRYFMDLKVDRHELENTTHSSSNDPEIAFANMSWAGRVAKGILESGWITAEDLAWECPFDNKSFAERVIAEYEALGFKNPAVDKVRAEFERMGVIEQYMEDYQGARKRMNRAKFKWQTCCEAFTAHTNVELMPYREFLDNETGENSLTLSDRNRRIGIRASKF